jgi:hypothetical protein
MSDRWHSRFIAEDTAWIGENKVVLNTGKDFPIQIGTLHVVAVLGDRPARGLVIAAPSAFAQLIAAVGTQNKAETPRIELFDRISAEIGDEILGTPGTLPSVTTEMGSASDLS